MNESENRGSAYEAIFGIIFIFAILIFFLYKFGTNNESVANTESQNNLQNNSNVYQDQINNVDPNSDIYGKYIKEVYNAQVASGTQAENNNKVDEIISQYKNELVSKVEIPEQNISLKNVSPKFNPKIYVQNFEILFNNFKKAGGTSESKIIGSQIIDGTTLIPLSDYDKETILQIATEYDNFAEKLINLSTPTSLEKKVVEIVTSAKNVAFILRQMTKESDKSIYTLWITKYAENMSVIITDRYGIQQ